MSNKNLSQSYEEISSCIETLSQKAKEANPSKRAGLKKVLFAALEFLEDPSLTTPISFATYRERLQEFLGYCEGYLLHKKRWSEILSHLNLSKTQTACEICPGVANKALWGLATTSFRGKSFVLNRSSEEISKLIMLNELFFLPFSVEILQEDLFESKKHSFDLLLCNHIIDDLLLSFLSGSLVRSDSEDEESFFERQCKNVLEQRQHFESFAKRLASVLHQLLHQDGQMVLLEYSSLYLRAHSYMAWEDALSQVRNLLVKELAATGLDQKALPAGALLFGKGTASD